MWQTPADIGQRFRQDRLLFSWKLIRQDEKAPAGYQVSRHTSPAGFVLTALAQRPPLPLTDSSLHPRITQQQKADHFSRSVAYYVALIILAETRQDGRPITVMEPVRLPQGRSIRVRLRAVVVDDMRDELPM